jgi:hypothetical protein
MTRLRPAILIATLLVATLAAAILIGMGRPPICTCGVVKLWEPGVNSAGNSQHLSDWYSFSHIEHGFLFYVMGWLALHRRLRVDARLLLAVIAEAAWEILENSPIIIDRYRAATVLNSLSDIAMMALGFVLASRLPIWVTAAIALTFELVMLWVIRDNLTLNMLMLAWPIDAIKVWQAGG